ncbi:MAG TPA: hypothetical protein VF755_00120 [Catenuloplanes sp.]
MAVGRRTSRRVALTAAFLTLAAGGTAACDDASVSDDGGPAAPDTENVAGPVVPEPAPTTTTPTPAIPSPRASSPRVTAAATTAPPAGPREPGPRATVAADVRPAGDDVFYCADAQGTVVDEENCDADASDGGYFLYYSTAYLGHYTAGSPLPPGGGRFSPRDQQARARYGLPAGGTVSNGTIKTNIVGQGGTASGTNGSAGG